jgi:hypothetical protein
MMKLNLFSTIFLGLLYLSCGQASQDDTFREKINKIKKEDIPTMDFTVSTYSVDSSKHWNVISQITNKQKLGVKSTVINSEFKQGDRLVKAVSNDLKQKIQFQGQIITTDLPDKMSLCYLLVNDQNVNSIFKISCKTSGEFLIEKIDSSKSKEWTETKLSILSKN